MAKRSQPRRRRGDAQEVRLRAIFGVAEGESIPRVHVTTLRHFYTHLVAHLTFPFEARLPSSVGPHCDTQSPLSVLRLLDAIAYYAPEEMYGLICKAKQNDGRIELPLDRIDVPAGSPNYQLLEDYCSWLRNG